MFVYLLIYLLGWLQIWQIIFNELIDDQISIVLDFRSESSACTLSDCSWSTLWVDLAHIVRIKCSQVWCLSTRFAVFRSCAFDAVQNANAWMKTKITCLFYLLGEEWWNPFHSFFAEQNLVTTMLFVRFFFTALRAMQTRSSDENSVRPSVCLSVTRVHCDKTEERSVQIFIPYERTFVLVFWEEEWLVGDDPFHLKFWVNQPLLERNRWFWTDNRS